MNDQDNDWRAALGAGLVLAVLMALIVTATNSWSDSAIASWVQAIGAIVTIFAGVLGVVWQIGAQSRRDQQLRVHRVKIVANALFQCRRCLTGYCRYAEYWDDADRHAEEAKWWLDALTSVPAIELPTFGVHTTIGIVSSAARKFKALHPPSQDALGEVLAAAQVLCKELEKAEIVIEKHLNRVGEFSPDQQFELDGVAYFPAGRTGVRGLWIHRVENDVQLHERKPEKS